jgi:hypothetical protein
VDWCRKGYEKFIEKSVFQGFEYISRKRIQHMCIYIMSILSPKLKHTLLASSSSRWLAE